MRPAMLTLALILAGCSGQSSTDDTPTAQIPESVETSPVEAPKAPATTRANEAPKARIGSTISLDGQDEGVVVDVTVVKVVDPAPPGRFLEPKGRLVAIQLRMTNTGTQPYDDSPSNAAKLVDKEGQSFNATFGESAGPPMGSVTIAPGDSRLGFITFDVPKESVLAKFQLALDSGFADETGEWLLI